MIQSFGSRINFHPNLHFLVTEGGTDKKGQFHRLPHFNHPLLCRFFTLEVFSLLLRKQLINKDLVQKILQWRHTGFNVHSKVRTETKEETEREGEYIIDIFDSEGYFISQMPLKLNPVLWENNKLYATEESDEGYIIIKRYEVSWE